jgi:hypothetical protein
MNTEFKCANVTRVTTKSVLFLRSADDASRCPSFAVRYITVVSTNWKGEEETPVNVELTTYDLNLFQPYDLTHNI